MTSQKLYQAAWEAGTQRVAMEVQLEEGGVAAGRMLRLLEDMQQQPESQRQQ
jgi:hypothetical protein